MTQPDFGPKPTLRWLSIAKLSVDMAYQRSLETRRSQQLIGRIAGGFRWSKFGAVLVAPLPFGSFALLDGQHRVAGARQLGIQDVPCIVIEAASKEEQAQAFVGANRDRVTVTAYALHHAMVAAGDPRARAIARVCEAGDVEIPRYPIPASNLKPNQTLALGTIGKLLGALPNGEGAHEAYIVCALTILRVRFAEVQGALRAHLIQGLVTYMATHPIVNVEEVVALLDGIDLPELEYRIQAAMLRGPGTRATTFADLLAEWNRARHTAKAAVLQEPGVRSATPAEVAAANGKTIQGVHRVAAPKPFNPRALSTPATVAR